MVIFDPFWRMDTGNLLLGRLVSHRRKSLCTCLGGLWDMWFQWAVKEVKSMKGLSNI